MPDFAFGGFSAVFDLGEQFGLDPNSAMCDFFCERLSFADQRFKSFAQYLCRGLVEAVVDLAGINELLAFAAAQINAFPFAFFQSESCNRKRLTLAAGFLDPIV